MTKNKIKNKNIIFAVFALLTFANVSFVNLFANFNKINVADYLANAVHIGKKDSSTNRFEFNLDSNGGNWFYYNYNAVSGISCLNSMNSSYMSYDAINIESILIETHSQNIEINGVDVVGITNGRENYVPIDLKIVCGDYQNSKYDCLVKNELEFYSSMISKSLAEYIVTKSTIDLAINDLIGCKLCLSKDITVIIDCVVEDSCLANNYSEKNFFIASNYLAFSKKVDNEKMVFKLLDLYYSNYTLFNKIFIVGNFPKIYNDSHSLTVVFPMNDWVFNESKAIYLSSISNYSFALYIAFVGFFILGLLSCKFCILKTNDKESSIRCFIFLFLFLLFFVLSKALFNGLFMFGIHINTNLAFSGIIEILSIIIYVIGYLILRFFEVKINDNKFKNGNYLEIEI